MPGLLYADDLVLCCEMQENQREMVGWFAEVSRRREMKVNAGKSTELIGGLEFEVHIDRISLEHVSEFKYLGCVLDKSSKNGARWQVEGGLQVPSGS